MEVSYIYVYTHIHIHFYTYAQRRMYAHICVCICLHVQGYGIYVYICLHISICIYTHVQCISKHSDTQKHTHIPTPTPSRPHPHAHTHARAHSLAHAPDVGCSLFRSPLRACLHSCAEDTSSRADEWVSLESILLTEPRNISLQDASACLCSLHLTTCTQKNNKEHEEGHFLDYCPLQGVPLQAPR